MSQTWYVSQEVLTEQQFDVGFGLFMGLFDSKTNIDYCQPQPLKVIIYHLLIIRLEQELFQFLS